MSLSNIPFKWGGTSPESGMDCFTYASYVRQQYGDRPFYLAGKSIRTAYKDGPEIDLQHWAARLGLERLEELRPLALVLLRSAEGSVGLGTVVEAEDGLAIAYMGPKSSRVRPVSAFKGSAFCGIYDAAAILDYSEGVRLAELSAMPEPVEKRVLGNLVDVAMRLEGTA